MDETPLSFVGGFLCGSIMVFVIGSFLSGSNLNKCEKANDVHKCHWVATAVERDG